MADNRETGSGAAPKPDQPSQQESQTTAPGPHTAPDSNPEGQQDAKTQASPADDVSEQDEPRGGEALAVAAERSPVLEPAPDKTGVKIIDPAWIYSGYWGPLDEATHPALRAIRAAFPDAIEEIVFFRDEVTARISTARWVAVVAMLREQPELSYRMLSDLTAVDMLRLRAEPRFDVVATLYSIPLRQRLRLKTGIREDQPCPTLTGVHKTAGWLEREAYDMFGITFEGHPDLRRMLLPEDWDEGHPLRKDYPIRGYKQYVQPGFEDAAPRITDYRRN
jgi:NADH-quinone oxidoreductase subunit C